MKLYLLDRLNVKSPYHDAMALGTCEVDRAGGCVQLVRAGPHFPPIFLPSWSNLPVVVTDPFRKVLEARFPLLTYRPVVKKKVVEYPWETWDFDDIPPDEFPDDIDGFSPIDYINHGDHSPEAAAAAPECWEVIAPVRPMDVEFRAQGRPVATLGPGDYRGIFTWEGRNNGLVADAGACRWLHQVAKGWVAFESLEVVPPG